VPDVATATGTVAGGTDTYHPRAGETAADSPIPQLGWRRPAGGLRRRPPLGVEPLATVDSGQELLPQ
jgi:hypothetical protein